MGRLRIVEENIERYWYKVFEVGFKEYIKLEMDR